MPTNNQNNGDSGEEVMLPRDAATADDNQNPRRRRQRKETDNDMGVIVEPEARHDLTKLVLHDDCREDIAAGIRAILRRDEMERVWNLSAIQPQKGRCILNFYGPPG